MSRRMGSEIILETEDLTKEFAGFVAVNGVNLRVERGTIHALIGPNGAGKTTCFNLLTKFLQPDARPHPLQGRATSPALAPADVARLGARALVPDLGGVPASDACWRTCASRCSASAAARSISGARRACSTTFNDRAHRRCSPTSGLPPFAGWPAVELPYGRKRALEIATTLALDPEMLLLDEPTAGMGHEDIDRIADADQAVAADRTVLMVEHNLSVVANLSHTHHRAHPRPRAGRGRLRRRSRTIRRCAKPIWGSAMLDRRRVATCSASRTCRPGTASRTSCTAWTSTCAHGEVVTLLGRNGAGKTTTLKSIMGIVGKRTGSVRFEGRELIALAVRTRSPARASPSVRRSAASSPASTSRRT